MLQTAYGVDGGRAGETIVNSSANLTLTAGREWTPLVPIQPKGNKRPFFCVHGGLGNVMNFYDLTRYMGPDQPFYGLQARGVDGRQRPFRDIPAMATCYIKAMRAAQPEGPYSLGGFSMGGEVAYEMARQLTAVGQEVALVALLDTLDPMMARERHLLELPTDTMLPGENGRVQNNDAPQSEKGRWARFLGKSQTEKMASVRGFTNKAVKRVTHQVEKQSVIWRSQMLIRLGRTVSQSLIGPYLWEAHTDALVAYRPQPYDGHVVLFRSSELKGMEPSDRPSGWEMLTDGRLITHIIQGTHNIVKEPYVGELARLLQTTLAETSSV